MLGALAWAQSPFDVDPLIERAAERARAYAKSLPDFECTEIVQRYMGVNPKFTLTPSDKLTIRIRYSQRREEHKLMLVNNRKTLQTYEALDGAVGTGEFGATLSAIFDPDSLTGFEFVGSKMGSGRQTMTYRYFIDLAHSHYHLWIGNMTSGRYRVVAYHGILEVDAQTAEVLHFSYIADRVPKELDIRIALTTVDYALADVGGQEYLLPARSVTELRTADTSARNEIEFRDYHKFSADSSIDFGPVK